MFVRLCGVNICRYAVCDSLDLFSMKKQRIKCYYLYVLQAYVRACSLMKFSHVIYLFKLK